MMRWATGGTALRRRTRTAGSPSEECTERLREQLDALVAGSLGENRARGGNNG